MNTGVFVAEPNRDTYQDIMNTYETAPSYNRGDQGFLNHYFNQSANFLPGNYNLMIKFTVRVYYKTGLIRVKKLIVLYSISRH